MKKRDNFFKLYGSESDPILKAIKLNNFKKAQNSSISKKEGSKKQYYQNHFQKFPQTLKKLQMEVNQLLA